MCVCVSVCVRACVLCVKSPTTGSVVGTIVQLIMNFNSSHLYKRYQYHGVMVSNVSQNLQILITVQCMMGWLQNSANNHHFRARAVYKQMTLNSFLGHSLSTSDCIAVAPIL